jgi:signal transduction histidine kinase
MKTNTEAIEFMNALVSKMDSGVISFDMEGYITLINVKAIQFLNLHGDVNEIVDTEILPHIEINDLASLIKICLTKSRKDFHLTNILFNEKYLIIDGRKLLDGMLLSITDTTENVKSKDEATQSLLLGQEMERRRLAKEIHDGVGPNMSTLKLQIDAIKKKAGDDLIIKGLQDINESISSIAADIRQISHDLMPSSLIDFGVVTALSNFSKKISDSSDIKVHFQSNFEDKKLSKEHELNIFRIVQELVNNALKYSQSNNIEISLRLEGSIANIQIQDDGIGMDVNANRSGIGLYNIRTRVESLHGEFDLESQKGAGVTAHINLPLN